MEPNGGVSFKAGYLLLRRLPLGHKGALPFKVSISPDVLFNIEVGKTVNPAVYVGYLRPQVLDGRRRHALGFLFVFVGHAS
ncbi:hypothetical protein A2Z53_00100 [Candidatus Giovannonibacteria bacterium RIFCSPHIGHO2_02_42_15]|uniref:Uncharacterized protein n=1 Tax=Candidatus Giovannonibacteria bacterium RIFCSPHIGHO2_02_42_15 TaxID=1798329 RepID=A0A1F5VMM5_9BACT|nr:MAG: hypothetical protein A2Z53_00100 [Candidatus Giovannonibacteria bacterium RIFCSPHIGHO2_02_42_15]